MHLTVLDVESTLCILSVDRKREVSKLNVGVVLIISIREISNHENEFDVNSRNIRPSKITRYTVHVMVNDEGREGGREKGGGEGWDWAWVTLVSQSSSCWCKVII